MLNVATLAPVLQLLFTTTAEKLALEARFYQRRRKYGPGDFLQALTLGFLRRRRAPLEALAQPLGISRQALDQRLDKPTTAHFCRLALLRAVGHLVEAKPLLPPLLARFNGVYLDDCTSAWLPQEAAADFPGTGGPPAEQTDARMKLLVRWEIQAGNICHVGIHPGRTSDHEAEDLAPTPPPGSLHVADLGFADFGRLQGESQKGVYVLSRLPAQTRVHLADGTDLPLADQLDQWHRQGVGVQDVAVGVGNKVRAEGRLVALACPADVVARRLARLEEEARRRGRPVSGRQRQMCRWTVLFTNVPAEQLSAEELWQIYRLRWQVELLFKRFKSEGGLSHTSSKKRYRVETEWYARLLAQVVRNWLQLLRGGPLCDLNPAHLGRVISDGIQRLAAALRSGEGLEAALTELDQELQKVRQRTKRRKRKTAAQTLEDFAFPA